MYRVIRLTRPKSDQHQFYRWNRSKPKTRPTTTTAKLLCALQMFWMRQQFYLGLCIIITVWWFLLRGFFSSLIFFLNFAAMTLEQWFVVHIKCLTRKPQNNWTQNICSIWYHIAWDQKQNSKNKNNDKQQQYDHKMKCTAKNGWSKKSVVYMYM